MRGRLALAACLAAAAAALPAQAPDAEPNLHGKLYRSVFESGPGGLAPPDLAAVSEPLRTRLRTYLDRRAAFRSAYKGEPGDVSALRADAKRRAIERAIVSLVAAPDVTVRAAEFVAAAPVVADWAGLPDGPLAEAAYAENILKQDPASPLAPWLYVFIADRQRIAFEACENAKDLEGMKAAARKYRAFADRARRAEDPIYPALLADMERQPFLYLRAANHPRDYDPDT